MTASRALPQPDGPTRTPAAWTRFKIVCTASCPVSSEMMDGWHRHLRVGNGCAGKRPQPHGTSPRVRPGTRPDPIALRYPQILPKSRFFLGRASSIRSTLTTARSTVQGPWATVSSAPDPGDHVHVRRAGVAPDSRWPRLDGRRRHHLLRPAARPARSGHARWSDSPGWAFRQLDPRQTAGDHFGCSDACGISSIFISNSIGGIELTICIRPTRAPTGVPRRRADPARPGLIARGARRPAPDRSQQARSYHGRRPSPAPVLSRPAVTFARPIFSARGTSDSR